MRAGDWKLIEFFEDDRLELYNLAEDPGEQNNLAQSQPDRARDLYKQMLAWRQSLDAPMPLGPNPKYDPDFSVDY